MKWNKNIHGVHIYTHIRNLRYKVEENFVVLVVHKNQFKVTVNTEKGGQDWYWSNRHDFWYNWKCFRSIYLGCSSFNCKKAVSELRAKKGDVCFEGGLTPKNSVPHGTAHVPISYECIVQCTLGIENISVSQITCTKLGPTCV